MKEHQNIHSDLAQYTSPGNRVDDVFAFGATIVFEAPLSIGDGVQIGDVIGRVEEILGNRRYRVSAFRPISTDGELTSLYPVFAPPFSGSLETHDWLPKPVDELSIVSPTPVVVAHPIDIVAPLVRHGTTLVLTNTPDAAFTYFRSQLRDPLAVSTQTRDDAIPLQIEGLPLAFEMFENTNRDLLVELPSNALSAASSISTFVAICDPGMELWPICETMDWGEWDSMLIIEDGRPDLPRCRSKFANEAATQLLSELATSREDAFFGELLGEQETPAPSTPSLFIP